MERDQAIGRALSVARGDAFSQQAVADAMRQRGWKWSQATVWSVEKGERPLRLAEAEDLAYILGRELGELLAQPEEVEVVHGMDRVATAISDIVASAEDYLDALDELAFCLDELRQTGQGRDYPVMQGASDMLAVTLEDLVREAQSSWQKRKRTESALEVDSETGRVRSAGRTAAEEGGDRG